MVTVLCTQDKWIKAKGYIRRLMEIQQTTNIFAHSELESIHGFFVYVLRTYPAFSPYLKGLHMTLDSWGPSRDSEGWKVMNALQHHLGHPIPICTPSTEPPKLVTGVPRLASDLEVLSDLFASDSPHRRVVRSSRIIVTLYGFGDASGEGFGRTLLTPKGLKFDFGLWGRDISNQSSNYREFKNLVDLVELEMTDTFPSLTQLVASVEAVVCHSPPNMEMFLFTDSSVGEGAFYRGTSPNRALFELVLRLWHLEMQLSLRLHVIHVSGQRMIAQGTDGLSRGDLDSGVMRDANMLSFVPLHLSALDRGPGVLSWLHSWSPGLTLRPLSPMEWYTVGHGITGYYANGDGVHMPECSLSSHVVLVWTPAPAAAKAAIEELGLSRHKRPHLTHIVACPRLCTHSWRKRLYKIADYVFFLPAGRRPTVWPAHACEPLIVGVVLPLPSSPRGVTDNPLLYMTWIPNFEPAGPQMTAMTLPFWLRYGT
jgi:hypothetical protein